MGNAIPEYAKVRSFVYSLAVNGTEPERKMPSEKELCELFRVSRVTVRNAIEPLVSNGILISKRGMGTFVNPGFRTNRELNSYTLGYVRFGGMQSTNQMNGIAAQTIELCGMEYEPLHIASGSVEQFAELTKGLAGVVWDNYSGRSRPYLKALRESGHPFLLLTQEDEENCDIISEDKTAEGRLLAEYALENGHRNILFLCRADPKYQLEEGTPYVAAMRRIFNIPPGLPVPDTHLLHYANLREFIRNPEFRRFTMIYAAGTISRQVMEILNDAGISVPDDISYAVYNMALPQFFGGLRPTALSLQENLQTEILDWLSRRICRKDTAGLFRKNAVVKLLPGQTVKHE